MNTPARAYFLTCFKTSKPSLFDKLGFFIALTGLPMASNLTPKTPRLQARSAYEPDNWYGRSPA
jgi:hypothetical protein